MRPVQPSALAASAAMCLIGFTVLSCKVARRETTAADGAVREAVQDSRALGGDNAAEAVGPLGKEWFHFPVAVALSSYLLRRRRGVGALAPLLASVSAELVSRGFDRLHLREVPPGHPEPRKPSYPSGHALEASAVALTAAYTLARADTIGAPTAFSAAAAVALSTTAGRVYLDRHWASDAIGGWLAGAALAAVWMAFYDQSDESFTT